MANREKSEVKEEQSKVRVNCTLTGKPAEALLDLKKRGIVISVREGVTQGLLVLHDQIIEKDLKEARLKTLSLAEEATA